MTIELESTETKIAKQFSRDLRADIGPEALREVVRRNKAEKTEDCCHSHDFCDANMVMLAAMAQVLGKTEDEVADDMDGTTPLWNEAWSLAFKNNFYI